MDVQTRRLRSFIALAEELHFSRTAARLHIAQQALSRQVRGLEDDLGARLFERDTRSVRLTPAGAAFLERARVVVAALDEGAAEALRLARGQAGTLRLGYVVGAALELTRPILEAFAQRHPEIELDLREHGQESRSAGLAEDTADVAFVRLPISAGGLELEPLFTEPLMVALPSGHPLAARDAVAVGDLVDEPIVVSATPDAVAEAFWALDAHRDAAGERTVLYAHSVTEELALVSAGKGCAITSAAAARYTPHPSVRYRPIRDVPGVTLALAWRAGGPGPLGERFVATAREVRDREQAILAAIERPALA